MCGSSLSHVTVVSKSFRVVNSHYTILTITQMLSEMEKTIVGYNFTKCWYFEDAVPFGQIVSLYTIKLSIEEILTDF